MSSRIFRVALAALLVALLLTACRSAEADTPQDVNKATKTSAVPAEQKSTALDGQSTALDGQPAEDAFTPRITDETVLAAIDDALTKYSAAAVSVAVVENGQVTACAARGWAKKDTREMTVDTKVRAASISKVVIAMGVMKAAEDGMLDLDAALSTYWGESVRNPKTTAQPSARTLMTHTSSISELEPKRGLERMTELLSGNNYRSFEPGNGDYWCYSNFGAAVLGVTLELATQQQLDLYLRDSFFTPLDISASYHSGNFEENELATLYGPGYKVQRSTATQASFSVPTQIAEGVKCYAGGLTISAPDLAKIVAILAGDGSYDGVEYLSAESVAAMETPYFSVSQGSDVSSFEQCLILRRQDGMFAQSALCYHPGSTYGVYHLLSYNPETGNGVVVLTTGASYRTNENGIYSLPAEISSAIYAQMDAEETAEESETDNENA